MTFEAQSNEIAGFDLYWKRQESGRIELGHTGDTRTVDEWPEAVTLGPGHNSYTLEFVRRQTDNGVEELGPQEAEARGEPSLEWGIYA